MKLKTESIMKMLKVNGKVVMRLDPQSGLRQLTVTRVSAGYAVAEEPGGRIRRMTESDVRTVIDDMSFMINKWF